MVLIMPVPRSKVLANKKYRTKTYDTIGFDVPKGKREEYKEKAASLGLSLAKFLTTAADAYGASHAGEVVIPATSKAGGEKVSAEERRLLDAAAKFPSDTRKLFLKLVEDLAAKLEEKGGDRNGNE